MNLPCFCYESPSPRLPKHPSNSLLADSDGIEDLTPRELIRTSKGKCDRTVTVYGYVRGTNLRLGTKVHIPGVGDLDMNTVTVLGDPCPLPTAESEKKRKLSEKKKLLIHAPMSDVGGVMYDKDAVWVNVPGSFTRGNLDGRHFIVLNFWVPIYWSHLGQSPKVKENKW